MSDDRKDGGAPELPQAILENLLKQMGFEGRIERIDQEDGEVLLQVSTDDPGRLIGRNAQVLEALQTIVNRMARSADGERIHYVVDVERYRERRKEKLLEMAAEAADRAESTGGPVRLPPMGARDRRIIHRSLADRSGITTSSEETEEEGQKIVVVSPSEGDPDQIGNR